MFQETGKLSCDIEAMENLKEVFNDCNFERYRNDFQILYNGVRTMRVYLSVTLTMTM